MKTIYEFSEISQAPKNKIGIYAIKSKYDSKIYIGKTRERNGFRGRWAKHLYFLRKNKHFNPFLQNSFNSHSERDFSFLIIESCSHEENLVLKEKFYIDKFNSMYYQSGWNIIYYDENENEIRYPINKETHKGLNYYKIQTPSGEVVEGKNVAEFARRHNLNVKTLMYRLNPDKIKDEYNGYISLIPKNKEKPPVKIYRIIGPDKKVYIFSDITKFAKEHKLKRQLLFKVVNYINDQHWGWYMEDILQRKNCDRLHPAREKLIFNIKTSKIHKFNNIEMFYKRYVPKGKDRYIRDVLNENSIVKSCHLGWGCPKKMRLDINNFEIVIEDF